MDKNDIHYRLTRFSNWFSKVLLGGIVLGMVGMVMKMMGLPAGGFVFVFAMSVLMLLLFFQIGISFMYVMSNLPLALLGAFCSLGLVLGFLAIIFRFQVWMGWRVMLFVSLPVYLFSGIFMLVFFLKRKHLHAAHRKFLYLNLIIPFAFAMLLFLISFSLRPAQFYKTFKAREAAGNAILFPSAP